MVLPDLAGGNTSLHIPTPNLLSAPQISDLAQVNVGLSGEIGNLDGSDDWEAFLNATGEGVQSFGGGGTPDIMLDTLEFSACQRNFRNFVNTSYQQLRQFH